MATKTTKRHKTSEKSEQSPVLIEYIGNFEKHPFFVKKLKKAKEFINRVGLPKELTKKS